MLTPLSQNIQRKRKILFILCPCIYTSSAGKLPLTYYRPGLGPRLISKQIPDKRDGMTTTGPNEYFRVGWVLGQEVRGTILSMQFQIGAHSSTMNATGS